MFGDYVDCISNDLDINFSLFMSRFEAVVYHFASTEYIACFDLCCLADEFTV